MGVKAPIAAWTGGMLLHQFLMAASTNELYEWV